eukprot:9170425-Alexandrium_andersonii.AAC.1
MCIRDSSSAPLHAACVARQQDQGPAVDGARSAEACPCAGEELDSDHPSRPGRGEGGRQP